MADQDKNEHQEKDPIVEGSLLWPIFLSVLLMIVAGGWALYDEFYTRRPYKSYQNDWLDVAHKAYTSKMSDAENEYLRVTNTPGYKQLEANLKAAQEAASGPYQELADELRLAIQPRLAVLDGPVKNGRSIVAAETFRVDTSGKRGEMSAQDRHLSNLDTVNSELTELHFPGEDEPVHWTYPQMLDEFNRLKALQGQIQSKMGEVKRPEAAARKALAEYVDAQMIGPRADSIQKLITGLDEFDHEIKQIHVKYADGELVERCESCHVGIRSPIELSYEDVGGRREFMSHPHMDTLLATHDPEVMGCSPCHGGNGIGVMSVEKAHGLYKHWLWPLHAKENVEAGCAQCHQEDFWLEDAEVFNHGKHLFKWRGCVGCHRHTAFTASEDEAKQVDQGISSTVSALKETQRELARTIAVTEDPDTPEDQLTAAFAKAPKLKQDIYQFEKRLESLRNKQGELLEEEKDIGPNLREVSAKLKPEWIQPWLAHAREFRPTTKMPQFAIDEDQAWSIAAFLWQNSDPVECGEYEEGDEVRGEELITARGCLGCHTISTSEFDDVGSSFASNLDRVGEKANFNYLVSWIMNPRHHNPKTVMPSLRLSEEDARDIATFLTSKVSEDAEYPEAEAVLATLQDQSRFAVGEKLVKHFGCAGCHEIKGLENEDRVGTELTLEGSKPLERLDFGLLTHDFEHDHKYKHKNFFEEKLRNPQVWDQGKSRAKTHFFERLKMPTFFEDPLPMVDEEGRRTRDVLARQIRELESNDDRSEEQDEELATLRKQEATLRDIDALTTFLLGSVEASMPPSLEYMPEGAAKDIQEGWWVVKKYNCQGCHQILPGETPDLWKVPIYEEGFGFPGVPGANGRPPTLVGQGTRTDPAWLSRFLLNPSLAGELPHGDERNGIRQGMMARMPTFYLSERERGALVRFFTAMSNVSENYVRPDVAALEEDMLTLGRNAFIAGDCANCHLLGGETDINPDSTYAPSFEQVADRIQPGWVHRWVTVPNTVIPGTAMPALLQEVESGDGGTRWVFDMENLSDAIKGRLGPEGIKLLADYPGDHADLLVRYFAHWNDTEAEFQKSKR